MKAGNVIEVSHITKSFKVFLDKGHTLKEKLLFKNRRRYEERKVLNDISFEVKKGEAIGLIGQNGCGKSTMLKLLSKIMYPDSGTIEMEGRVSSLIELGAGFHPDMSGRENIYINAAIFGLTKKEIDSRLEDIIAFSELEEFIENPVRTYSSGMYMRLAFSVAINVDADILLVDEILAVGDAGFQAKCFNKLKEIKASGTTIVLVSHSMGQVEMICDKSYWIDSGIIRKEGKPREVVPLYLESMAEKQQNLEIKEEERQRKKENEEKDELTDTSEQQAVKDEENKSRFGNGYVKMVDIKLLDADGNERNVYKTEEACVVSVSYKVNQMVENAVFGIGIFRNDGVQCYSTNTRIEHLNEFDIEEDGQFEIIMDKLPLLQGEYWIDLFVESGEGLLVDNCTNVKKIKIVSDIGDTGISRISHKWII